MPNPLVSFEIGEGRAAERPREDSCGRLISSSSSSSSNSNSGSNSSSRRRRRRRRREGKISNERGGGVSPIILRSSMKGKVPVDGEVGSGNGDGDGSHKALPKRKDKSKRKQLQQQQQQQQQQPSPGANEPFSATTAAPPTAPAPAVTRGASPLASPAAAAAAKSPAQGETGPQRTRKAQHHQDNPHPHHHHHKLDRSESRILSALVQQGQEAAAQAEALRNEAKEVEESAAKHAADAKERARGLVQASKARGKARPPSRLLVTAMFDHNDVS